MRKQFIMGLAAVALIGGCSLEAPDEKAIRQMLETFFTSVGNNDEQLARAILLDRNLIVELNPDVSARVDAESYEESLVADIIERYRDFVRHFQGRMIKVKRVNLGTVWYQYKGRQAFKDTQVILETDGEEFPVTIRGIVRAGDRWRIVDLSGSLE